MIQIDLSFSSFFFFLVVLAQKRKKKGLVILTSICMMGSGKSAQSSAIEYSCSCSSP